MVSVHVEEVSGVDARLVILDHSEFIMAGD